MKLRSVVLSLVVLAGLTTIFAMEPNRVSANPAQSAIVQRVDINRSFNVEHGLPAEIDIIMTEALRRRDSSESVRVVSYRGEIRYETDRSAGFRGAPVVALDSAAPIEMIGLTLFFGPEYDPIGVGPVKFSGSIAPVIGKTWGQVGSEADLVVTLRALQVPAFDPRDYEAPVPMRAVTP